MTFALPIWGLCAIIGVTLGAGLIAYACGAANGTEAGIDWMKREAIRAGVAKACDFDGGWRWWTPQEIAARLNRRTE